MGLCAQAFALSLSGAIAEYLLKNGGRLPHGILVAFFIGAVQLAQAHAD